MTNGLPLRPHDADAGDDPLLLGALQPPSLSLSLAGDDLPLLTDALEAAELDRLGIPRRPGAPPPPPDTASGAPVPDAAAALADELARSVDAWLERELPQIVAAELDTLAARIRAETHARMRTTLLPALSARLARRAGGDTG
ncbi:hypothetical protein [Thauera chlorobenzoica]|uniref:Uncharacterized protein n=1 Tax=Thauera chlorobenzoica TaxID=96773 RepID=A0A1H5SJR7_9RHOO|nr:hypothetical protein [Thauera chlorobenzoica]APR04791.1 hypothetical protein Tchl_1944 [Thauera chlorobenzoica]SEF50007.1 hypothetical protein SAMN05216242_101533 [Thauera chlorobenzoica]